ncbi:hypothetical protein OIDMADRAFT_30694 [Oidiodendron maius Zn]|uniref:Uncharacterized protein n=1 Tax=Oidiodendron maius (strain Zn) TaxID=913774 RepID=A0A0C3H6X4_OIDMZ|nr:hypothetical protein OIDMADRAFT_30694 [Oidiodendron maius Zn]
MPLLDQYNILDSLDTSTDLDINIIAELLEETIVVAINALGNLFWYISGIIIKAIYYNVTCIWSEKALIKVRNQLLDLKGKDTADKVRTVCSLLAWKEVLCNFWPVQEDKPTAEIACIYILADKRIQPVKGCCLVYNIYINDILLKEAASIEEGREGRTDVEVVPVEYLLLKLSRVSVQEEEDITVLACLADR